MKKLFKTIEKTNEKLLFAILVGIAIVLAAQMQSIQKGWINPDSVLYLEAAKLFTLNDYRGAYEIFNWPFYALCIGLVSKITHFSVHLSAQFLNMVLFGIATAAYLNIIKLAGGKNLSVFAGAWLLFSNTYIVGDVLEMLMRDEGFWAFYLTSLVFFIRFYLAGKTHDAILWQISIATAVLFRIEAITYQLLLPLFFVFSPQLTLKQRLSNMLKTYSISLIALSIIFTLINTIDPLSIQNFGRLQEVFSMDLWSEFSQNFIKKSGIMSEQVLGGYLDEYATAGLLLTFAYIILVKNISTLGIVGLAAVGFHFKNKFKQINAQVKQILIAVTVISLFNMGLIITKVFVLSSRYVVAFTFILLIVAALFLGHLFKQISEKTHDRNTIMVWIIMLVMCLSMIKNILPKAPGYNYEQEAVTWLASVKQKNETVFYNETRMRYYANEPFIGTWSSNLEKLAQTIESESINQYHYLLVASSKKQSMELASIRKKIPQFKLIKTFKNRKGQKFVLILKRSR